MRGGNLYFYSNRRGHFYSLPSTNFKVPQGALLAYCNDWRVRDFLGSGVLTCRKKLGSFITALLSLFCSINLQQHSSQVASIVHV